MFLDKLTILAEGEIIREVHFKKGINLILDRSASNKRTSSGNSVGKTTLLRMVDFCFGSEGTDVYIDQEFNRPNEKVLQFLRSKNVTAILEVIVKGMRVVLSRSFGEPTIFKIDDTEYSNETDYKKALETIFFNIKDSKPSLRQIMPKFIRKDVEEMSKSVKYLHPTTTDNDYELIYTFLFGVSEMEMAKERHGLKKQIAILQKKLTALKDGNTMPALREAVRAINRTILDEEAKKKVYDIDEAYDDKIVELQNLKKENANVSQGIAELETEIQMHLATLNELKANISNADPRVMVELYKEAAHYVKEINKDFEQLLYFHNHLIENKLEFVQQNIGTKMSAKEKLEAILSHNLSQERDILRLLSSRGAFDDLEILISKINKLYEEKGKREQLIEAIDVVDNAKKSAGASLNQLDESYRKALKELENNISNFNKYFQDYAKSLYGEDFIFSFDDSKENLKFLIENIEGNMGSGKKKATVAAFDFAFISFFAEKENILPRFVFHDGIEDIVDNQIKTLFDIATTLDGQYVVSLIHDRLSPIAPTKEFLEKNTILWLSQDDKFFKLS